MRLVALLGDVNASPEPSGLGLGSQLSPSKTSPSSIPSHFAMQLAFFSYKIIFIQHYTIELISWPKIEKVKIDSYHLVTTPWQGQNLQCFERNRNIEMLIIDIKVR